MPQTSLNLKFEVRPGNAIDLKTTKEYKGMRDQSRERLQRS